MPSPVGTVPYTSGFHAINVRIGDSVRIGTSACQSRSISVSTARDSRSVPARCSRPSSSSISGFA